MIALLILSWPIVDYIRPKLQKTQKEFERSNLKRHASDVLNAAFTIRIYRLFIEATCAAKLKHLRGVGNLLTLEELTSGPFIPQYVSKEAYSIESLFGLGPLKELADADKEIYANIERRS